MVEEKVDCLEVEAAIGAIALEQQDPDFLARAAFVLGRSYAASHRPAQRVAASTADFICSVVARGATVLSDPRFRNEMLAVKHFAQKQGIGEPGTWRSLQRFLWQGGAKGGLLRLLDAMAATLPVAKVLDAEAHIASAFPDLVASDAPLGEELAAAHQHHSQGRPKDALVPLQIAVSANPLRFEPEAWIGDIHMAAGDTEAARDAYAGSAARPGAPADIHAMLGVCHGMLGETDAAIAAMRQAVALAPDNMIFARWLANFLVRSGLNEDAEPLLRELARRHPEEIDTIPQHGPL